MQSLKNKTIDTNRFKNPYFWFGVVAVILTAMDVTPESLTSMEILLEEFKNLITNPYKMGLVIVAVTGIFVEPTSTGLLDNIISTIRVDPQKQQTDNKIGYEIK